MKASSTTPQPGAEPYINKREVAKRMGRTVRTVENMMRQGRIPYYRFDGRVSFRWSEIQSHLADTCRVGGKTQTRIETARTE